MKPLEVVATKTGLEEGRARLDPRGWVKEILRDRALEEAGQEGDRVGSDEVKVVPGADRSGSYEGGARRSEQRAQTCE